jgi:lipoprotein signal peptidase
MTSQTHACGGGVAAVSVVADLWSKEVAFERVAGFPVTVLREQVLEAKANGLRTLQSLIPAHEPVVVAPKLLNFTLVLNPGAVFGIGAGQRWFFIFFTTLAIAFGLSVPRLYQQFAQRAVR